MAGLSDSMREMMSRNRARFAKNGDKPKKPKEGKTRYRILPFEVEQNGQKVIWAECGTHWIKPSKDAKPLAVVGNSMIVYGTVSQVEMMVDSAIAQAKDTGDEDALKVVNEWRAKRNIIVNALILDGADKSDAPQLVDLTPTCWGDIMGAAETYDAEGCDLFSLTEGYDIFIERAGKGLDTTYSITVSPKASAVPKGVMAKCINPMDYIAKEHFRGEEPKALAAIQNLTGLPLPGATTSLLSSAPRSGAAAALTAPKAAAPASRRALSTVVEDAPVLEEEEVPVDEPVEEVAPEEPEISDEDAELAAAEAALEAARKVAAARKAAAAAAKVAPAAKPAAVKPASKPAAKPASKAEVAPPTAPESFGDEISSAELDDALADLEHLI